MPSPAGAPDAWRAETHSNVPLPNTRILHPHEPCRVQKPVYAAKHVFAEPVGCENQVTPPRRRCSGSRTRARCCWSRISIQSRRSERAVRTNRSATPLACGARNGVRTV